MEFILLNKDLEKIKILDQYESLIWTDRYYESGDFELYTAVDRALLDILVANETLYVWSNISEHLMVVEQREIKTSFDDGSKIIVTGRSAESLLERRIIWGHVKLTGSLQEGIKKLINENVISPSNSGRKIPNFIFKDSTDPKITSLTVDKEYSGDNLYDTIIDLCIENKIGFIVSLNELDQFVFELYAGTDHSYNQTENPFVIFSSDFENLGASNYTKSYTDYRNVVGLPRGTEEFPTTYLEYNPDNLTGIDRREVISDERESKDGDFDSDAKVKSVAKATLKNYKKEELFEGQVDSEKIFVYGRDFRIGDVVQIRNEYGIESVSRVTEIVINHDQDTYEMYPTFETVEEEDTK